MLVRELPSVDFPDETLLVDFYRRIEVPARNGEIGKRITPDAVPPEALTEFKRELSTFVPE